MSRPSSSIRTANTWSGWDPSRKAFASRPDARAGDPGTERAGRALPRLGLALPVIAITLAALERPFESASGGLGITACGVRYARTRRDRGRSGGLEPIRRPPSAPLQSVEATHFKR